MTGLAPVRIAKNCDFGLKNAARGPDADLPAGQQRISQTFPPIYFRGKLFVMMTLTMRLPSNRSLGENQSKCENNLGYRVQIKPFDHHSLVFNLKRYWKVLLISHTPIHTLTPLPPPPRRKSTHALAPLRNCFSPGVCLALNEIATLLNSALWVVEILSRNLLSEAIPYFSTHGKWSYNDMKR